MPGTGSGPGEQSGGSGFNHQNPTTLTNAQFKKLTNTPIEVVPNPGIGKAVIPALTAMVISGFSAHPYTGANADGYLTLAVDSGADIQDLVINDSGASVHNFTDMLSLQDSVCVVNAPFTQGFLAGWGITGQFGFLLSAYANSAVSISINNNGDTADLGGGDEANSMVVNVSYLIFNTLTGEFE